jgi:hypothetical protein
MTAQAGTGVVRRRSVPEADFKRRKRELLAWALAERERLQAAYKSANSLI